MPAHDSKDSTGLSATLRAELKALFTRHFNAPPIHIVHAPARLELLGNHTDYNEGLVMSVAVDRYIHMASSPRNDGKIELVSSAFPERETFRVDEFRKNPQTPWANYVKGVLEQLHKRKVNFKGFNAAISGNIPMGAGMSSSAALEVATALTVRSLYPYSLTAEGIAEGPKRDPKGFLPELDAKEKLHFARLCQAAENQFVGVRSGLLDQVSCLCGKAWQVMSIDFRSLMVEYAPMAGEAIIVCNSGVKHELIGGEYNELRENCEAAAQKLGAKSLRSVELKQVEANKKKLGDREYECARHVVSEIQRVVAGEKALRENDHGRFGEFMFQSHESSRTMLKNSTTELDLLVALARGHKGCLGARLTGGGFGGATINLVAHHEAESFMAYMSREYEQRIGVPLVPIACQIVNGAG